MAQSIGLGSHFLHGHLGSKEQRCMQLPLPMGRFSSNILKLNRDRYVVRRRICAVCEGTAGFLGVANAPIEVSSDNAGASSLVVDLVSEALLKENGLINTRRTKLVCTIGPASSSFEQLDRLAVGGMNVARINMCHNTREWHRDVIRNIKKLNEEKGYCIAVMMDTEGSQMHMADLGGVSSAKAEDGSAWVFTLQKFNGLRAQTIQVNYDDLVEDIMTADEVIVDGGMARFEVVEKVGSDLHCRCTDPGLLLPRAKLTFWRNRELVGRNVVHPTLSTKDWIDIDFAISEGVDFIAVSFVKTADVIMHLKSYVASRSTEPVRVLAKIESLESLEHLEDIIQTSDGVMVARGDLGAQIPLEQIPSVQEEVVNVCRQLNKPVIIASQLLESMIEYPTPTRAEVADVSEAVRQYADALMLSGESAMGLYSEKALSILRTASLRMEQWCREENRNTFISLPELGTSMYNRISEQICNCAVEMANKLGVHAIFVYTKQGYMASLLSRNRPNSPIFAFTDSKSIRQQLNLCWGLVPFGLEFSDDMENNICNTFSLLKDRGMMKSGDLVLVVLDIPPPIQINIAESVQVRQIT